MKKNIMFILIIIFSLFLYVDGTSAKDYECSYKTKFDTEEYTFTMTFKPDTKQLIFSNICWNNGVSCRGGSISELDDYLIKYDETLIDSREELTKEREEKLFSGKCDSTLLVFRYWSNSSNHFYFKVLFNDTLEANAREYMNGNFSSGTYKELTDKRCDFDESKSTAPPNDISYTCKQYKKIFDNIEKSANKIKNCTGNNCMSLYPEYEGFKAKLKNFCTIQYQYLDYGQSCMNACLESEKEIEALGVEKIQIERVCGFSEKLILYIANIAKWGKYLIPVVVIVLGILDFIKAIASEKDDEMKKAQGHFVKRLIAAALIFIVPFIIEFILDKMGFASNGCGIIDL